MKRSITIRNKVIPIWLLAVILTSILVTAVTAAIVYQMTIQGTVTVEETPLADYSVEAYEDWECTKPLTCIDFGVVKAGHWKYAWIYLKNMGDGSISKISWTAKVAGITASGHRDTTGVFKPGDVMSLRVGFSIPNDATAGSYPVTVTLDFVA